MSNTRKVTNKLCELADDGILSWEMIAKSCLDYMSESEVADMAERNELYCDEEEEEDED